MKRYIHSALLMALAYLVLTLNTSCKHEPDYVPGNGNTGGNGNNGGTSGTSCSPDTVYFTQQVLPIIQSGCAKSGCHDAATHKERVVLDSYANIMSTGGIRIDNPTGSKVYRAMTDGGEDRMPPAPATPINADQLALIEKWIRQGARNNSCLEAGCDTSNVRYSTHILPLIQNTCQGCHSGSAPDGGIDLTTWAGVNAVAGDGRLYGSVNHLQGYSAMPKNGNPLTDCQKAMIRIWIQQGAPNN
jgi:uncharacterized membrane protein